jgi:hypothetical protein
MFRSLDGGVDVFCRPLAAKARMGPALERRVRGRRREVNSLAVSSAGEERREGKGVVASFCMRLGLSRGREGRTRFDVGGDLIGLGWDF